MSRVILILLILVVVLFSVGMVARPWFHPPIAQAPAPEEKTSTQNEAGTAPQAPATDQATDGAPQAKNGLTVDAPRKDTVVKSPLEIKGSVNGDDWNAFEGQAGTVTLQDEQGKTLATAPLKATSDWTQTPVTFKTTLKFAVPKEGMGLLIFRNENPSGDPSRQKEERVVVRFGNDTAPMPY